MTIKRSILVALFGVLSLPAQATTKGYWDLWALDVGLICFGQNAAYRNTPLGNMVLNSYGFAGWDAFDRTPASACLRSKQWVSEKLCTAVTNLDATTFRDLGPFGKTHEAELQGLQDVIVYYYKSREPNGGALQCPAAK
jgi:hypothetical protein